jgi:hypothetical protein
MFSDVSMPWLKKVEFPQAPVPPQGSTQHVSWRSPGQFTVSLPRRPGAGQWLLWFFQESFKQETAIKILAVSHKSLTHIYLS